MTQTEIEKLVKKQRDFFNSGETLNVSFRISALEKLRACIIKYEKKINQAIRADLGKTSFESYMCQLLPTLKGSGLAKGSVTR